MPWDDAAIPPLFEQGTFLRRVWEGDSEISEGPLPAELVQDRSLLMLGVQAMLETVSQVTR